MTRVTLFRDFAEDRRTSMEVYADNLCSSLHDIAQDSFELTDYRPVLRPLTRALPEKANLRMRTARYVDYPLQARCRQGAINHILDHGYAHLLQVLNPRKTVITVHDIMPILAGRGLMPGVSLKRRNWLSEWSASYLKRAAKLIAISNNTRCDLIDICGCDGRKIEVIYSGLDKRFRPQATDKTSLRRQLGLPDEPAKLVLITGQEYYKNQSTSLKVMERLAPRLRQPLYLVRLGRSSGEWRQAVSQSSFRASVIELDFLPAEQMPILYSAVDCLLFPSWYEGFGWPPVEVMACGTPVVTSNAASLPEAVGDAGLMRAPDDVAGLAEDVARLLEDETFRQARIEKGLRHVKRFDWAANAGRVLKIYQQLSED